MFDQEIVQTCQIKGVIVVILLGDIYMYSIPLLSLSLSLSLVLKAKGTSLWLCLSLGVPNKALGWLPQ